MFIFIVYNNWISKANLMARLMTNRSVFPRSTFVCRHFFLVKQHCLHADASLRTINQLLALQASLFTFGCPLTLLNRQGVYCIPEKGFLKIRSGNTLYILQTLYSFLKIGRKVNRVGILFL